MGLQGAQIGRGFRLQLDPQHQAKPAHFADHGRVVFLQAFLQIGALLGGHLWDIQALHLAERGDAGRAREGVAAKGGAVHAGREVLDAGPNSDRTCRHAAAYGFPHGQQVRRHTAVLEGEPFTRAAKAGLYLVEDQKRTALVREFAQQVSVAGPYTLTLPLSPVVKGKGHEAQGVHAAPRRECSATSPPAIDQKNRLNG